MKYIYGGNFKEATDFVKKNRKKIMTDGDGYRIIRDHLALKGVKRGSVEVLAVGRWKNRDGSRSVVQECVIRKIDILTENGYHIKDGEKIWQKN